MDANGNWSEAATASARARYVTAYATITSTSPAHYETVASRSVSFAFTSSEEGATFECSLDDGPFEACTSPKEYTGLSDSALPKGEAGTIPPHVFRVRAVVDGIAGRGGDRYWYVDATAPTVEIERGPHGVENAGYYNKTDAGFLWNFYDMHWDRNECSLDGAPFGACPVNVNYDAFYRNLSDGEHTFRVRSIDDLGHVGEDSSTWVVDTQAPATSVDGGPAGTVSAGTAHFALSSAGGSPVTFRCGLDGAAFTACDPSQKYSDLANGKHTFSAQATDKAGNIGPVETRTWTVAPDRASGEVGAGGTLSSDAEGDGATDPDPVETTITSPVAGPVSIEESVTVTQSSAGYSLLGQQVNIEAPAATADNPLRFAFILDSTLIPAGEDQGTVQVFRNGARVADCADQSGAASPDPCVLSRTLLADGDVKFAVLTSHASAWNFGVVDRVAPTVKGVTPPNLAKNVSAATNVTATFSEAMTKSTVNKGTFYLVKKGTATRIPAAVGYSAAAKKATLNPSKSLRAGTTYTATVTGGAQDAVGNALTGNKTWTFTTRR